MTGFCLAPRLLQEPADAIPSSSAMDADRILDLTLESMQPGIQRAERAVILAEVLLQQFIERNEWDSLENAIDKLQDAIEDTEDSDDGICAKLVFVLSKCLRERYMRGRSPNEIDNAISLARDAVERTERNNFEDKAHLLVDRRNYLALCLFTKAKMLEDDDPNHSIFLAEAIDVAQGVSDAVRDRSLGRAAYINTISQLALFDLERYISQGTVSSLVDSIKISYDILADFPGDPSELVVVLSDLAFKLQKACLERSRGKLTTLGDMDLPHAERWEDEAISLMCRAMEIPTPRRTVRLEQALTFMLHLKDLPIAERTSMLRGSSQFLPGLVRSMPDLVLTLDDYDRQDIVSTFYGISRYAAASLLVSQNPDDALEVLETGRGIVLSTMSHSDAELADLRRSMPILAEEYQLVRTKLQEATTQKSLPGLKDGLLEQLNRILKTIREDPEFRDFNQAIRKERVLELAQYTDIAIINITDIQSDAILVSKGAVRHLALPELDEYDISKRSWYIQQLLAKTTAKDQRETFPELHKRLSDLLKSLWKSTVKPVLDGLNHKDRPSEKDTWPHVCWIPTGVLGLYPIHAAGPGLQGRDDAMRRVISSYAPTLKALSRSRQKWQQLLAASPNPTNNSNVAAVVMDETPARIALPLGMQEVKAIEEVFPGTRPLLRPKKEEVMQLLEAGVSLCHFTCHGETDYSEPFKSMLLLQDWEQNPLTISDLRTLGLRQAVLASLSACFTANAGVENLQDEIIHLASAMQVAGFINVVGSLWYVGEQAALEVVREFYRLLGLGNARPAPEEIAKALHFAVLKFRETTRSAGNGGKGNPVAWAPFVHYGC